MIRLNHKDFADWQKLYPNLDLPSELLRLDIEYQPRQTEEMVYHHESETELPE
ncbi:hypothetical protein [Candidatus Arsenophonus triatominarum]|uniref:hypothetical protein n=1 Tax=Candidatus Arsenophonus triatominarum TaxID=57911 RepID=UPI00164F5DFE|nr:hypothetical protein [Candidatus Arsenophonus triatominarum]